MSLGYLITFDAQLMKFHKINEQLIKAKVDKVTWRDGQTPKYSSNVEEQDLTEGIKSKD